MYDNTYYEEISCEEFYFDDVDLSEIYAEMDAEAEGL